MKKGISTRKLNRTSNERKQLFRSLIRAVATHGYIETTEARAKAVNTLFDKLITTAKINSLASSRQGISYVGDTKTAHRVMKLGELFAKRPGGYTRLIKMGYNTGNNASITRLELVEKYIPAEVIAPKPVVSEVKTTKPDDRKLLMKPVQTKNTKRATKTKKA